MTLNELQILLALNGNERIEYAECEIFANIELYTCYLESICSDKWWMFDYDKDGTGELAWLAYMYASDVIDDRWLEAEPIVVTDSKWTYYYAVRVIKSRWPEAEDVIATSGAYLHWYNDEFGTNI